MAHIGAIMGLYRRSKFLDPPIGLPDAQHFEVVGAFRVQAFYMNLPHY